MRVANVAFKCFGTMAYASKSPTIASLSNQLMGNININIQLF